MRNLIVLSLLYIGMQCAAQAVPISTPEIDASSCASAVALLTGAVLVFRGRRKS